MTFVIGSVQLTITRLPRETREERVQRDLEWKLLEERITAARQEAYRQVALNAYGLSR